MKYRIMKMRKTTHNWEIVTKSRVVTDQSELQAILEDLKNTNTTVGELKYVALNSTDHGDYF